MELDQVETFLAVATFGGFHRAAEALRVSQPAVSARIKALEQSLGVPLFERGGPELALSPAGRALRPHAEQLLRAAALARQAVHELRPLTGGALQVAAGLSICQYFLPDVLKHFQEKHPRIMVTVRSGHSKEVLELVLSGEAEIGIARSLHHPELETLSLREDPLLLIRRTVQKPKLPRRARLEEVATWPLIFYDRNSSDWMLSHGMFRRSGLVPNVVLEVEAIETAKKMVERGLGLAFLPHLAVARELRRGTLMAVEIVDAEPEQRSIDAFHSRHRPLSQAAIAFLNLVRNAAGKGAYAAG